LFFRIGVVVSLSAVLAIPAAADSFFFSTGSPDGKIATGSRPSSNGKIEIESADDFVLTGQTSITSATFTGLLTGGATVTDIGDVKVEIYRVFPEDSDVGRTSGAPTFSTPQVPTRVNSPSDVEFADRDSTSNMTFTTVDVTPIFTASNSVLNGIHPIPGFHTGGDGSVTGDEVEFSVTFTTPFDLPEGHYFFVPQVEVTTADGEFMWLSAPKPIVPPGTPFPAGFTDLQAWIRNEDLAPDWLRIGTDIVGGTPVPTYNMAFSLNGQTVPEPSTWTMLAGALGIIALGRKRPLNR
jgi:hypothetical protein